ncbi:transposase [Patescibacteria group bacterium]|nr:transposase [Patescibacteria group bacterium]
MNIEARKQYMETLRERYLKGNKREKGKILDEYCQNTGQERKYVIKKFRYKVKLKETRKKRKEYYDNNVKPTLVEIWNIFDRPCGQRLKPLIGDELRRLIELKEIQCSNGITSKLKKMSSATIDRKLKHEKEVLKLNFKYSTKKNDFVLLNQVPVKTSADLDRTLAGNIQMDCVEHCGMSASGEYANSLTTIDILFGWWEGEAFPGKGQERTLIAIDNARKRSPVEWKEMHPDNGMNLLNWHVYTYAEKEGIEYSRSRPYKKNDNCFVEQKNSTHVRRQFGYLRYDTREEINAMNDLYRNELRLFKNFFQPVMKLVKKERIKGKIHRKYDKAKTPYHRIMESDQIDEETKRKLSEIYENLNPAELKREIDKKIKKLYEIYSKKNGGKVDLAVKKLIPSMVSFSMMHLR